MARNHTDITQLEEVDMREVAQKPCLNLEGIIEESCLEPINSDDYWLFKCRIEDYRNRRCPQSWGLRKTATDSRCQCREKARGYSAEGKTIPLRFVRKDIYKYTGMHPRKPADDRPAF